MVESLYMKHMGLRLRDMRMRYEVDHDSRLVHAELLDGFDSELFISFCRTIEKQEGIRLIDIDPFGIERHILYRLAVDVFGLSFHAKCIKLVIAPGAITVVLSPITV